MLGAVLGTFGFVKWGPIALIAPVLFLFWIVVHDYAKPIADVREIDPTADKELAALFGSLKSILPAHVGLFRLAHHRAGRLHRAPDFTSWADRIPRHWRIVILVISPLTQFDTDTAAGLLAAVQRLQGEQRRLIISGMNRVQFKTLMECGLGNVIDLDHFVPDLEFAVASAMNWAAELGPVEG